MCLRPVPERFDLSSQIGRDAMLLAWSKLWKLIRDGKAGLIYDPSSRRAWSMQPMI